MANIGVIDSGVGGLTVLFDVLDEFPNNNYFYIGDSKNCPYGDKNIEELEVLSFNLINYLVKEKDIDILIIACNTISSTCLNYLQNKFPNLKILDTIKPTINYIKNNIKSNIIGLIGTNATINSKSYQNCLKDYIVYSKACPSFVPIIEQQTICENENTILNDLKDILNKDIDTLILGCTHYPLLIPTIKKIYHKNIVTSSKGIIMELSKILEDNEKLGSLQIYTTGNEIEVKKQIESIFNKNQNVTHI